MFINKNCCMNNCNNNEANCNYETTGINAQYGYNTVSNNIENEKNMSCESMRNMREEMLNQIRCLEFAITDIAQYLNTHPTDEKALCLHREYCNQLHKIREKYQKVYGPLTITCPCNRWRWIEEPWPWEGSEE